MIETLPDVTESDFYNDKGELETTANETETENERKATESQEVFESETGYTFRIDSADNELRASVSNLDYSKLDNIWTISFNGGSYKVLFPKTEDLVELDGYLVNIGSNSITGVCLGNSMNLSTYFQRTFTVLPLYTQTAQSNSYRYGGHSYMTTWSVGTSAQLSQNQVYGDASVVQRGRLGASWSGVNVVIIGLLALQVLISFIGGLLKRG